MKNIHKLLSLSLLILLIISCSKSDDSDETTPVSTTPTPVQPVSPTPVFVDDSYKFGDITISSSADLEEFSSDKIDEVVGDLTINVGWDYTAGSSSDPSEFTKNIEIVYGDVLVNITNNKSISFENLVKVVGSYTINGHDVDDQNLVYANYINLDYEGDYIVNNVFTRQITLNLDDGGSSKKSLSSKGLSRRLRMFSRHPRYYPVSIAPSRVNVHKIRSTPLILPIRPVVPKFKQKGLTRAEELNSDNVESIEIGGHTSLKKINSNSIKSLDVSSTILPELEVKSTSLKAISMPNITTMDKLVIDAPCESFEAKSLITVKNKITLKNVVNIILNALKTCGILTVSNAGEINLNNFQNATSLFIPSTVKVNSTNNPVINQSGVSSVTPDTSDTTDTTDTTEEETHNSGGSS